MSGTVEIRDALIGDAEPLADIYNHYIHTSTVTFDTEPKTVDDRVQWLTGRGPTHPVLVAVRDGAVVGYGALSGWAARPAWALTAEVGVYLADEARGAGIGPALLATLVDRGRAAGLHVLLAQIVSDNVASIAMFERAGFRRAGTLSEVGRKFDRWIDVDLLELVLGDPRGTET